MFSAVQLARSASVRWVSSSSAVAAKLKMPKAPKAPKDEAATNAAAAAAAPETPDTQATTATNRAEASAATAAKNAAAPVTPATSTPAASTSAAAAASALGNVAAPPLKLLPPSSKIDPVALPEALRILRAFALAPQTIDCHVVVNMTDKTKKAGKLRDPIRGVAVLPHAYRPAKRVLVFAKEEKAAAAKQAGATYAGFKDLMEELTAGKLQYDVVLATPDVLKEIKSLGSVLRQNMPTVKKGTVSDDIASLVKAYSGGLAFKSDTGGAINIGVARTTHNDEEVRANLVAFLQELKSHGSVAKGPFFKQIGLSASRGPYLPLTPEDVKSLLA
eukprot:m.64704 g.64704  ORF g.64704 m.64704 type:complete len:332 (-) comp13941_c0_seq1:223-1218(-)